MDEKTLEMLDRMVREKRVPGRNRSQVIRRAVAAYLDDVAEQAELDREREIFRCNRAVIDKQAAALVGCQAKP